MMAGKTNGKQWAKACKWCGRLFWPGKDEQSQDRCEACRVVNAEFPPEYESMYAHAGDDD